MCDISISLTSSQAFTPLLCGHVCTVISSFRPWKVAFEYIACHNHYNDQSSIGCVILSELSGASQGLGAGALLVNPYDVPSVALTLHEALTWEEEAPEEVEEYRKMWSYLCEFVKNNTAALWAHNFISEMRNLDVLVTRINLYTFCTKTVGCKPESVRMLGMHAKRALYAGQKDPVCILKEPCMHAKRALYAC